MKVLVEKLVYGGDGLSRVDGEVILTPFVLPGETAEVEREAKRAGAGRARLKAVVEPSGARVVPRCPYFGRCGGCHYQHASYEAQLAAKTAILLETLGRIGHIADAPEPAVLSADPWGYRNRIQLHFADGRLGYLEARSNRLCAVDQCPISSPVLNECIQVLNRMVRDRRWPSFLSAAELFTNEKEVQFNVLQASRPVAQRFFDWLREGIPGLVTGALEYEGFRVSYGSFFQVNRFLVRPLVEAVIGDKRGESAVDLYAGVGLFTLPLASRFGRVTAVESGSGAARDLAFNAERAGVSIKSQTEDVETFLAALETAPDFVLADPPRTGLGRSVTQRLCALGPQGITVVACDPTTFARDAALLIAGGYRLEKLTLVDLFPETFHIETVGEFGKEVGRPNLWLPFGRGIRVS